MLKGDEGVTLIGTSSAKVQTQNPSGLADEATPGRMIGSSISFKLALKRARQGARAPEPRGSTANDASPATIFPVREAQSLKTPKFGPKALRP